MEKNQTWLNKGEGELSLDIFEDEKQLIVKAPIAGTKPEDLNVSINNDLLTIQGERRLEEVEEKNCLYQECFWGKFSRSVILPVEVKAQGIKAFLKDGILTIVLSKTKQTKSKVIKVKNEE